MKEDLIREVIQWDTVNWSKPLLYWEQILSSETGTLKCLELGCNQGGLSLWLAMKGHSVLASDLKDTEVHAQPLHQKNDLLKQITYQDIDASKIPYENQFDIIIFKSILGGIGRNDNFEIQEKVVREIHKALKPGGRLLFAENTLATALHKFFRKNFTNWGKSWRYVSLNEMRDFLSIFSSYEMKTCGFLGVFGRSENQKRMLGKIDRFIDMITPSKWRYIVYGVARK